jgi:hypothetical protein
MFILCRIPDEEAGEIPAACVVLKQDTFISSKEIKEFVASKVLCISILDPQALHEVPSKVSKFIYHPCCSDKCKLFLHNY